MLLEKKKRKSQEKAILNLAPILEFKKKKKAKWGRGTVTRETTWNISTRGFLFVFNARDEECQISVTEDWMSSSWRNHWQDYSTFPYAVFFQRLRGTGVKSSAFRTWWHRLLGRMLSVRPADISVLLGGLITSPPSLMSLYLPEQFSGH